MLLALARNERAHVALGSTGEWWCAGGFCGLAMCSGSDCTRRDRAACFSSRYILSDRTDDDCRALVSDCEDARARVLTNRDVDSVGACRVVSAATDDKEAYRLHSALAWSGAGLLSVTAVLWLIIRLDVAVDDTLLRPRIDAALSVSFLRDSRARVTA